MESKLNKLIATFLVCSIGSFSFGNTWTIVDSYTIPEGASGLAFDGTDLYCGIYGADGGRVYRINRDSGIVTPLFVGEHGDAFGLTYDGEYLWTTDHPGSSSIPAVAMKLDWNGDVLEQIELPDHYMSGIAYDNGNFWVARYYEDPGHLYKITSAGMILTEFDGPDDQPWDLAIHDDTVWIADYWGDTLYRLDQTTGAVIQSNASEGVDPAGIVWDGEHLWYCDDGLNYDEDILYKVQLDGVGSSEIFIADQEHDFGIVPIGESEEWLVSISNIGTASLVIDDISFGLETEFSCSAIFPITILENETQFIPIVYAPNSQSPANVEAIIYSNDPIQPSESLFLSGEGVYAKPVMEISENSHNYGEVRINALTRWEFEVTNIGIYPLEIYDVVVDHPNFSLESSLDFPITLGALESTSIGVWFNPSSTDLVSHQIELLSNSKTTKNTVQVEGSGVDIAYPIGETLWSSQFTDNWDNSFKAIHHLQDINGDGVSDVIGCSEDNYIRCFNGNADQEGDVLWAHEIYSGNIYSTKGLDVVEDVNFDGFSDVVVGATGGARLIRMISGKTGEELWTYHTDVIGDGGWVYQVDGSRDFNGDGYPDVLAGAGDDGKDSGPKRAYCFDGLDGDLIWQRPTGGPVYCIIAVDDFTGDGVPDAVAGTSDEWEINGRAVGINGATGLQEWSFDVDGSSVWGLCQAGDGNGDGIEDVMIGDFYGDYYLVNLTNGQQIASGGGLGLLIGLVPINDVNGDGYRDVVPKHFSNYVRVISGADCTTIWSTPTIDSPTVISSIPDINANGYDDLVVGTLYGDNYTYFIDGESGVVLNSENFNTPVDAIASTPDINGDGSWELVAGGRDGTISCLSGGIDAVVYNPADINEDGVVGVTDLLIVIDQWGQTDSIADINEDGIVNVSDLLMLIDNWGA